MSFLSSLRSRVSGKHRLVTAGFDFRKHLRLPITPVCLSERCVQALQLHFGLYTKSANASSLRLQEIQ